MQLKIRTLILFVGLMTIGTARADSESGSMSRSCSGRVLVCNGSSCASQSFYIYGYQYAYIYNGEVRSESHSLSTSGALGNSSEYQPGQYTEGKYVVHSRHGMDIALPWDSDYGIYMRQTGDTGSGWRLLCAGDQSDAPAPGEMDSPQSPINESGSMSRSCSASTLRYCEGTSCSNRYFYIYAYQYASVSGGRLSSESHSLSTSGLLEGDYTLVGLRGRAVAYHGPKFDILVPWRNDLPITARQSDGRGASSGVQVLCAP